MNSEIRLSSGEIVTVDTADFAWLSRWKWYANSKGYACRRPRGRNGRCNTILMHRLILNPPVGLETDHINRNRLDNRRANLRAVTRSENHLNRNLAGGNATGTKGVFYDPSRKKWRVSYAGKDLGRYPTLSDAIAARHSAESNAGA